MALAEANIATLEARLAAPLLGVLPYMAPPDAQRAAGFLRLPAA
jgi:dethiobiotin synthetase